MKSDPDENNYADLRSSAISVPQIVRSLRVKAGIECAEIIECIKTADFIYGFDLNRRPGLPPALCYGVVNENLARGCPPADATAKIFCILLDMQNAKECDALYQIVKRFRGDASDKIASGGRASEAWLRINGS